MTSRLTLTAAMVVVVGVAGCTARTSALYVKKCLDKTLEIQDLGFEFGQKLRPWFDGQKVDADRLEASYQAMHAKLKTVEAEVLNKQVPNSPKAKAFAAEIRSYLSYEERVIADMWNETKRGMETENPGSPVLRMQVGVKLQSLAADEARYKTKLEKLARDCGVTILPQSAQPGS